MKRYVSIIILSLIAAIFLLTACDSETPSQAIPVTDIAVLRDVVDGTTVFAVNRPETSDLLLLTYDRPIDTTDIKLGEALLIRYIPLDGESIDLTGCSSFTNLPATVSDMAGIGQWDATPVFLQSYTVVDRRVVVRMKLPVSDHRRRLGLVVDKATIGDELPKAYLVHEIEDPEPTYDRSYYVAFDCSELCSKNRIRHIEMSVNNSNLPTKKIIINLN